MARGWHSLHGATQQTNMLHTFDPTYCPALPSLAPDELSDEQLMERVQHRDETALAALSHRHRAMLRTIIGRMIHHDHDVDDLMQDCLLDVWRHASNYDVEKGHALGWIVTLVRRRTIDRIRRTSAYLRAQDRFRVEVETHGESDHAGADEEASESDRAAAVSRLIARLPEAQQQVVHLAFYSGMSQREIAQFTGVPLGTIKTRLELACRKLRSSVLAFGELRRPMPSAA